MVCPYFLVCKFNLFCTQIYCTLWSIDADQNIQNILMILWFRDVEWWQGGQTTIDSQNG